MKRLMVIFLFGLILAFLSACDNRTQSLQPTSTILSYPPPTFQITDAAYPAQNTNELFQITKPDKSLLSISIDTLNSVQKVTIDGHNGPGLADVINQLAGIKDYTRVTVTGSNGSKTLEKSQVTNDMILELESNNKLSLVIKSVSADQWIIDVSQLVFE